jgi:hypothetical protein
MVRPCVARGFRRSGRYGLASMYPASAWSVVLRAIMDISAHAVSLPDRPRTGPFGSPVFVCAGKTDPPSSSHPLADLGGYDSATTAPWYRRSTGGDVPHQPGYPPGPAAPKRQLYRQPYMRTERNSTARLQRSAARRWRRKFVLRISIQDTTPITTPYQNGCVAISGVTSSRTTIRMMRATGPVDFSPI